MNKNVNTKGIIKKLKKLSFLPGLVTCLVLILGSVAEAASPSPSSSITANSNPTGRNDLPPQPGLLMPYTRSNSPEPGMCFNPSQNTVAYAVASSAYGVITNNEFNNWAGQYIKVGTDGAGAGGVTCAFNATNEEYVAWYSSRQTAGFINLMFNRVVPGSNNIPAPTNLTLALTGSTSPEWLSPHLAYSIPQSKLFLIYEVRGASDGDNSSNPLFFIESADSGASWSTPLQLGTLDGYRPAEPDLIVDKQGLPHVFYGSYTASAAKILHRYRQADGTWTQPQEAATGIRPIFTQAKMSPANGDIYVTYYDSRVGLSRWDHSTGQWQDLSSKIDSPFQAGDSRDQLPTLGISSTGVLWLFWINGDYGGDDQENLIVMISPDMGQTWQTPVLLVHLPTSNIGRTFGMNALASQGHIKLLFSADQKDASQIPGPSLFLLSLLEAAVSPTTPGAPTPTPGSGGILTPVATPTFGPGGGGGNGTPTPIITLPSILPTLAPLPTYTPFPTYTPLPTYTPGSTYTPGPTYTPFPTFTQGATATATVLPTATATATPMPTPTLAPLPTVAQSQPQQQQQQPAAPVAVAPIPVAITTTKPADTPTPTNPATPTPIPPNVATATAYSGLQAQAALTPHMLAIPNSLTTGEGVSGEGPLIVLPTATPTVKPTATAIPTVTPTPTATVVAPAQSQALAGGVGSSNPTAAATMSPGAGNGSNSNYKVVNQKQPPDPMIPALIGIPLTLGLGGFGLWNWFSKRTLKTASSNRG